MNAKRRALLIGVPEYQSNRFNNLPIVHKDIELLSSSLKKSGYSVRSLGTDISSPLTCSTIKSSLRAECRKAKNVETLLLYFSGHGLHYEGKDYLVPPDALLEDDPDIEEYLVSTDLLNSIIDDTKVKNIIFVIDACRNATTELGIKQINSTGWSSSKKIKISKGNFVLVFACSRGQFSQYVNGDNGFSLFSKAFAEVLDPQHPARTLEQVLEATKSELEALVIEHNRKPQQIAHSCEEGFDHTPLSHVICEGTPKIIGGENSNPWAEAALEFPLWANQEINENATGSGLKQQSLQIITACWQQWQASIQAMPDDPWRDKNLPIRVLNALEALVCGSNPPVKLSDPEVALLVTVPFVREAVFASAVVQAAKEKPLSCKEIESKGRFRDLLNKQHQSKFRLFRTAKRLEKQKKIAEKDAVMSWLMHRCLMEKQEIWIPESEGGYLSDNFVNALQTFGKHKLCVVQETLTWQRLVELARCTLVNPERIDRNDCDKALKHRIYVGKSWKNHYNYIREKMLAYMLKMAWLLAIDIRSLSSVIVERISMADPFNLENVHEKVNQASWEPYGHGMGHNLSVTCNHPEIDVALTDHVEHADEFLGQIWRRIGEKRREMEALEGFPKHFMSDGIIAATDKNVPVYEKPHVNFQLAHDEVRELLMGKQLYGDPGLAIRELYQNALDACRYRKARLEYLKRTGKYQGSTEEWQGQIIFRQDKDPDEREYIECEDNGIGMDMNYLSQCFARAGRRFADLSEFIEEQAKWEKCDPPIKLYPNSQFGVGVLSYFMLADEIEVETCRCDQHDQPGEKLRVRIPGSSGLFRVQRLALESDSGTKVRLYLNNTHYEGQRISCIEILRELLWVAEFPTEVQQSARRETWEVGQLKHPELSQRRCLPASDDLWWVASEYGGDKGCLLSDGLRTEEEQPGVVVNLRQDNYPKLTVDRKKIVEYKKDYVEESLIQATEVLNDWDFLNLSWLWKFSRAYPNVASHIVQSIVQKQKQIKVGQQEYQNTKISLLQFGCVEMDRWLLISIHIVRNEMPWWLIPYRIALWGSSGFLKLSKACLDSIPLSMQPEFCPFLDPIDAAIFNRYIGHEKYKSSSAYSDGTIPPGQIIFSAWYLKKPITEILNRLQKFIYLGLEVTSVNQSALDNLVVTEDDLIAFSKRKNGKDRDPWDQKYIPIGQLVLASERINEPIAQTLERYEKFACLGLEIPEVEQKYLVSFQVEPEDIVIFSSSLDGKYPYPFEEDNKMTLSHIGKAAIELNERISETLKRLERFIPLGIDLPKIDAEYWQQLKLPSEKLDTYKLFIDVIGHPNPDFNFAAALVGAAISLNESIAQTFNQLQEFKELGLILPEVDLALLENITITPEDSVLFSRYLSQRIASKRIAIVHILLAAAQLREPIAEVIQRLKRFEFLGLEIPEIDEDLEELYKFITDKNNLIAISKDLDGEHPLLKGEVHPARIVVAACALDEPVPVTLERMRRFAHLFNITLPEGDPKDW